MRKFLASLAVLAMLATPSFAQAPKAPAPTAKLAMTTAQSNPILVLQKFTVADLQAALADAQAQTPPDTTAAACYSALIPLVQSNAQNPLPTGLGAFQALQKARDLKALLANIQSPTGPLVSLNMACAPLILDVQNTLIRLGIMGGGIALTAGIPLPLPLPILP